MHFYKTYEQVDHFMSLVRVRLLAEVIERTGLTRTDIGVLAAHQLVDHLRSGHPPLLGHRGCFSFVDL